MVSNNMNNKQKEVESKIRELVPSLQELGVGCKVKTYQYEKEGSIEVIMDMDIDSAKFLCGGRDMCFIDERDIDEIIGHPITLEHVLMAMRVRIDSAVEQQACERVLLGKWKFGETLEKQSQFLIDLLHDLLIEKE